MSYMSDPDKKHRGVGAIAAIDGAGGRRARAQLRKNRVMAVIDARNARLTHGPGRALPVSMGRISQEEGEPATGGTYGGGGGGTTVPPRPPAGTSIYTPPIVEPIKPVYTPPTVTVTPTSTVIGPIVEPGPSTTATPTTGGKAPYVPPKYTGGGGTFVFPSTPLPTLTPATPAEELGPGEGGGFQITGKTIALVAGGIGLLWLLTRDDKD